MEFDYKKIKKYLKNKHNNEEANLTLMPVKRPIQAGQGNTSLVRANSIEKVHFPDLKVHLKLECLNPTGSFKDRGSSVEVAKALEFIESGKQKKKSVICASTGNMGASVAAYSGIVGLKCTIVTPRDAAPIKLEQILAHGARVLRINGDYTQAAQIVEKAHRLHGHYLLGDYLYRREGTKTVGFEIIKQLPHTDYIFCPIGNGTLISAVSKAINEYKILGISRKIPKLIGVQASGCNPVEKAFSKRGRVKAIKKARTIAVAIECSDPLDGQRALDSVLKSGGEIISVTDKEILQAREILAKTQGIFAEPAGAASIAGLIKIKKHIPANKNIVCVVTGHGLKVPYTGVKGKPIEVKAKNVQGWLS